MELLKWMFKLTYCEYNGKHYILESGPIGLGATGEIAIIFMENFQLDAMESSPCPLDQWFWYVDDSEIKCKKDQSELLLQHLNNIEKGVIEFTKEEQDNDILPVLDLKKKVNRRTKQVECMVHYKKTHTNINVKERSNHPPCMKKGIIKGFADRARALCDDEYVEEELKNVEDVFVANGFDRETVKRYMKNKGNSTGESTESTEDEEHRGMVTIPYLQGMSEQFKRIANKHVHRFRTAFKPGNKVKEVKAKAQKPLGDKRRAVVYKIPCKCKEAVYIGETWRLFETRKNEHARKVRLTEEDIRNGKLNSAEERMGKEDGGLARHCTDCESEIDWQETSVITIEIGLRQRKVREGVESLRGLYKGLKVLNNLKG